MAFSLQSCSRPRWSDVACRSRGGLRADLTPCTAARRGELQHGLRARRHSEFVEDGSDVRLYRCFADTHIVRYLLVEQAEVHEMHDAHLLVCQRSKLCRGLTHSHRLPAGPVIGPVADICRRQ